MSRYAWANPSTGVREQDDSLKQAIERIQAELAAQPDQWADSCMLYDQLPKFIVSGQGTTLTSTAERLMDRLYYCIRVMLKK